MPWVKFTDNFDFSPSARFLIAYKKGGEYLVSQACADAAVAAGKGENVERPLNKPDRSPPSRRGAGNAGR